VAALVGRGRWQRRSCVREGGRVVHQIARANAGLHDFQSSRILSAPAERGGPQEY